VFLQLHPSVQDKLKEFSDAYSVLKNPRKLDFKPQLGTVHLQLEFDGVSVLNGQDCGKREHWPQPEFVTGGSRLHRIADARHAHHALRG
jgi:curved DNA-binding protein CbpA